MNFQKNKPIRLKGAALERLYREVFERDSNEYGHPVCQECGTTANIECRPHHKKFRSQGGSDTLENLETICIPCHGKEHGYNRIV